MYPGDPSFGGYGDEQAAFTQGRVSYGSVPAYMASGVGAVGYGAYTGMQSMFGQIGSMVRPVSYIPPARVAVGYYGQTMQQTGFLSGMGHMMGLTTVPRGTMHYDYGVRASEDFGNRMGSLGVGLLGMGGGLAMGAAMSPAMGMVGAAAGGSLGALAGPLGMAAGGSLGGFLGSAFGGYALGLAGAEYVNDQIAMRRQLNNLLEATSFRYVGAGNPMADPRFGGGMNPTSRLRATDTLRRMDFKDVMLDAGDISSILEDSSRLGLLSGTQDMADFERKFRDIVSGVKSVSKVLSTTLSEGLAVIKDLRSIGMDITGVHGATLQSDIVGRATGRTAHEVMNFGLQGAEIFRGTGVNMGIGFQSNLMNLTSIRAARDAGMLSQEAIAQAGGEEALGHRMTASGLQFAQSASGRGFLGAFHGPGGFDAGAFTNNLLSGGGSYTQLGIQAAQRLGSPASVIAYDANMERFMSQVGKQFGGQGLQMGQNAEAIALARLLLGSGATGNVSDALRYAFKSQGLGSPEIDARLAAINNAPGQFDVSMAATNATHNRMAAEESHINAPSYRLWDRAVDAMGSVFNGVTRPFDAAITGVGTGFSRFWEREVEGIVNVDVSGLSGLGLGRGTRSNRAMNLDVGGFLGTSSGERLLKHTKEGGILAELYGLRSFTTTNAKARTNSNLTVMDSAVNLNADDGEVRVVPTSSLAAAARFSRKAISLGRAIQLQKEGRLDGITADVGGALSSSTDPLRLSTGPNADMAANAEAIARRIFSKSYRDLSTEELAVLRIEAQNYPSVANTLDEVYNAESLLNTGYSNLWANDADQSMAIVEAARKKIGSYVKDDIDPKAFQLLVAASQRPELRQANTSQAFSMMMATRRYTDQRALGVIRGVLDDPGFFDTLSEAYSALGNAAYAQNQIGADRLSASLFSERHKLTPAEYRVADEIVRSIRGGQGAERLHALDNDQVAILNKTSAGAALVARKKTVDDIMALEKTTQGQSSEEKHSALSKVIGTALTKPTLDRVAKTFIDKGAPAASAEALTELLSSTAGTNLNAQPGGAARGTDGGSAAENAQVQVNINLQTLAIMQSLAIAINNLKSK